MKKEILINLLMMMKRKTMKVIKQNKKQVIKMMMKTWDMMITMKIWQKCLKRVARMSWKMLKNISKREKLIKNNSKINKKIKKNLKS